MIKRLIDKCLRNSKSYKEQQKAIQELKEHARKVDMSLKVLTIAITNLGDEVRNRRP